jgi:hypothetical protein
MNTNNSQSFLSVKSLDSALPDAVAGRVGEVFPSFELTVNEEGETVLGDSIANGTYRQRLLCNPYTENPSFSADKIARLLSQTPKIYNPDATDILGFTTETESGLIGQEFFVIPILRTRGVTESLEFARDQFALATGQQIVYPEGYAVIAVDLNTYLKPANDGL